MKARHLIGILCLALALSCSRAVEPGLYTAQGGFVRVFLDSLGNKKAIMYRDTSALWADTLAFDLKENEKSLILKALEECGGNRSQAALKLNISRRTLYRKLHEYGLAKDDGDAQG